MISASQEQGFTTVELLISLFIAAAFIGTGFQLFSVVTKDSNQAQLRSTAASIVNSTLQERSGVPTGACSPTPATSTTSVPTASLPQATTTVSYSCPYGDSSRTTRITVTVKYGTPQQTVEGSLDVTR